MCALGCLVFYWHELLETQGWLNMTFFLYWWVFLVPVMLSQSSISFVTFSVSLFQGVVTLGSSQSSERTQSCHSAFIGPVWTLGTGPRSIWSQCCGSLWDCIVNTRRSRYTLPFAILFICSPLIDDRLCYMDVKKKRRKKSKTDQWSLMAYGWRKNI